MEKTVSRHTYTNTSGFISAPMSQLTHVCVSACLHVCVCVRLHIPQKDLETRKREKHATKIPSSRGLFIEDSSCFFVSGPRVQKKRGEKEKRENSKKITGKKRKKIRISKKEKKKEQKGQISKSSWVLCSLFLSKSKNKRHHRHSYHKKRHKIKESCFLNVISCRRKCFCCPIAVLSLLFPNIPVSFLSLHESELEVGGWGLRAEEGKKGRYDCNRTSVV